MWKKSAIILALLLLTYTAAGFLLLPALLRPFAEERLTLALNRQATIRDIDFNPFTLSMKAAGFALTEAQQQAPVASFEELLVNFQIKSLFKKALIVREIRVLKPSITITRTGPNQYNFSDLIEKKGEPSGEPLSFSVGNIQIVGGALEVQDRVADTHHRTTDIHLNIPFLSNIDEFVDVFVQPNFAAVINGTAVSLTGQAKPFADSLETSFDIDLKGISLPFYMGYLPRDIRLKVQSGILSVQGKISYIQYRNRKPSVVALGDMTIRNLDVFDTEGRPLIALPDARFTLAPSQLTDKAITLSEVLINSPRLSIRRSGSGEIDWLSLFPRSGEKPDDENDDAGSDAGAILNVKSFALNKGTVEFTDASNNDPVKLLWSEMSIQAQDISTQQSARGNIQFSSRLNGTGSITAAADIALNPLFCKARMEVEGLELGWVQPYFSDKVQLAVTRGHLTTEGDLNVEQDHEGKIKVLFAGDLKLGDFASVDKKHADDFVKWRTVILDDIRAGTDPGIVEIGAVRIEDLFSQIIVDESGSLNLKNAFTGGKAGDETAPPDERKAIERIRIAKVILENGEVGFLDRSVNPSFSADLGEIWGSVSGLSSDKTQRAAVDLSGKLNYSAPLKITGSINPLADDIFVDLRTIFQNIELSAMTPYSGKYIGYAIEKGKISLDLSYLIESNELDARNDILIDQLTFGGAVQSEHATSLPVRLAVALLKDPNGRIDLRLPVKGRTDDPEFSVAGIILKMITNTISRAATSPFALLETAYPGASELGIIEFEPGKSALPAGCGDRLGVLSRILMDKPSLKLEIQGFADMEKDRTGLENALFEKKLKTEKLKNMVKGGGNAPPLDDVIIDPGEFELYLKKAYDASDFPKPRNFIGMPLSLKQDEMEKLIRDHITVTDSDLRLLALNRAQKVKECLMGLQLVDPSRIYLVEKNSLAPEEKEGAGKSRAELTLK